MITAPTESNETARLLALHTLSVLDTLPEKEYDDVVKLASTICGTSISLVSLVDKERQWFKAKLGLDVESTPRDISFCGHAIAGDNVIFEVQDTSLDTRFNDNPLVTGNPNISFYAGAVLRSPEGHGLGTLCVIHDEPKKLTEDQRNSLAQLANIVATMLHAKKSISGLKTSLTALEMSNKRLTDFADIVAHDLRGPLTTIGMATGILQEEKEVMDSPMLSDLIGRIKRAESNQSKMIECILEQARREQISTDFILPQNVNKLIQQIKEAFLEVDNIEWNISGADLLLVTEQNALYRIFHNLVSNAIKYSNKKIIKIDIDIKRVGKMYQFTVVDNGKGIAEDDLQQVFNMLRVTQNQSENGEASTGIGLSIVKSLVQRLGGNIKVKSVLNESTMFEFTIADFAHLVGVKK